MKTVKQRKRLLKRINLSRRKHIKKQRGGDPNKLNSDGYASLHRLAMSEEAEEYLIKKAKEFLALGANLDLKAKTNYEETPVILALYHKKPLLASFFLDMGTDPSTQAKNGSSLLMFAAQAGLLELVQRLQAMGNDPKYANKKGLTALHYTAEKNNLQLLKYLVEQGANINAVSNYDTTPLKSCIAVQNSVIEDQYACVKYLLENGADPNIGNVVYFACSFFDFHIYLPLLLKYGGNPNIPHYYLDTNKTEHTSSLIVAIDSKASLETVKLLIEAGADINSANSYNLTALGFALNTPGIQTKEIVKYLLENGANPNKGSIDGEMPDALSLFPNHVDLLSLFLKKGQDPNAVYMLHTEVESSLLYLAIYYNELEALGQLLDAGGNPNQIVYNKPILNYAAMFRNFSVVKLLIEKGADVNLPNSEGNTTLHVSVITYTKLSPQEKSLDTHTITIIQFLLANGADPKIKNKEGKLPADYANSEETLEMTLGIMKLWEGWSKGDVAFLNSIFTDDTRPLSNNNPNTISRATDFSLCPVCLKTVERPGGCMHMSHDCATQGGFYHKELYKKYKADGLIHWCTICNRIGWAIGSNFLHYNLGLAANPIPGKAKASYLFDKDCSTRSGGGGLPEKYKRFNELRNVALDFNDPVFIGVKSRKEVLEQLVEAMWDAPFVKAPLSNVHWQKKQWKRPNTNFPNPPKSNTNTNANITVPEGVQDPIVHPTETENFTNAMMTYDTNIIQFRHPQIDGSLNEHNKPGQQISQGMFESWLRTQLGDYTKESFGHCWQYDEEYGTNRCTAKLYPKEVRIALGLAEQPTEGENTEFRKLYEGYRKLFTRKELGTL